MKVEISDNIIKKALKSNMFDTSKTPAEDIVIEKYTESEIVESLDYYVSKEGGSLIEE